LASDDVILRLQGLAEDSRTDLAVRQTAIRALGRSGRKSAAVVLLDRLGDDKEAMRLAAADALTELTGQSYGTDFKLWRGWGGPETGTCRTNGGGRPASPTKRSEFAGWKATWNEPGRRSPPCSSSSIAACPQLIG